MESDIMTALLASAIGFAIVACALALVLVWLMLPFILWRKLNALEANTRAAAESCAIIARGGK